MAYVVNTKVYKSNGDFIGKGTAIIEDAEDKDDAKFQINHGVILANTPAGYRIVPDLRTLKPKKEQKKQNDKENNSA